MQKIVDKKFLIFQTINIQLVAVSSPYYCENTRRP